MTSAITPSFITTSPVSKELMRVQLTHARDEITALQDDTLTAHDEIVALQDAALVDLVLSDLPASVQALPLGFIMPGTPTASAKLNLVLALGMVIPADFVGTKVYDSIQATANTAFVVNRISGGSTITAIGTITITPTTHVSATLSVQSAATLAAGDVLQLVAPATPDVTLADIGITILAEKV